MPKQKKKEKERKEKKYRKKDKKKENRKNKTSRKNETKKNKEKSKTSNNILVFKKDTKEIFEPNQVVPLKIKFLKKFRLFPELMKGLPSLSRSKIKEPISVSRDSPFSFEIPSIIPTSPTVRSEEIEPASLLKDYQNRLIVQNIDSAQIKKPNLISIPVSKKEKITSFEAKEENMSKESTKPKSSSGGGENQIFDFGDVTTYEPRRIISGETGLPNSNPLLVFVFGEEGMGRQVAKDIFIDELEDRGRRVKPKNLGDIEDNLTDDRKKLEEITSDETLAEYRILSMKGHISSLEKNSFLKKEMKDALIRKRDIRYILFESSESAEKEAIERIFSEFPWWEMVELNYKSDSVESSSTLFSLGKTFAAVNNAKLSKEEIKDIVQKIKITQERAEGKYIDALWTRIRKRYGSAIGKLRPKYRKETELSSLNKESEEHYIMRMLTFAVLCNKLETIPKVWKEKNWEIDSKDEDAEIKIEYPKDKKKRADFFADIGEEKIWVEVETCKNLRDPLERIYQKLEKIIEINRDFPTQLWIVLPYRKVWAYTRTKIEQDLRNRLNNLFANKNIDIRIFLANLYKEALEELK